MLKRTLSLFTLTLLLATLLGACGGAPASTAPTAAPAAQAPAATAALAPAPAGTEAPAATAASAATEAPAASEATAAVPPTPTVQPTVLIEPSPIAGRTRLVWYVGLGAGGDPQVIPKEKDWVDKFNASQDKIQLVLQVVHNPESYDTLKAQIAAGSGPDIVGPVGKAGRASFKGAWLDIAPLVKEAGFDLTKYDPALLDFTKDEGVQVGIPFALFPSFLFINKALFDEAKLPYPPQKVGDKYMDKDWNLDTFAETCKKLTVDKNGNDATSADFDPKNITQFGCAFQYTDARGLGTLFGGGLPVDDKGNAKIPDHWKAAWKWYYDAVWKGHFLPTDDYTNSDLLAKGNPFSSGNVAMDQVHTWYTCCFDMQKTNWDIAVMPTINGKITAKLHGDTFAILKDSKHAKEAFDVMSKMVVDKDLYQIYGGMPAIVADRPDFFKGLDERTAPNKINWEVAQEMLKYPDLPNHESWLPNLVKANDAFTKFRKLLDSQPDLNVDAEIDKFQAELDQIFKQPAQ